MNSFFTAASLYRCQRIIYNYVEMNIKRVLLGETIKRVESLLTVARNNLRRVYITELAFTFPQVRSYNNLLDVGKDLLAALLSFMSR